MVTMSDLERLAASDGAVGSGAGQAVDVSAAVGTFILDAQAGGLTAATVRWYSSLLRKFAATMAMVAVSDVTANDVRQYMADLRSTTTRFENAPQRPAVPGGLSPASIAGHSTAIHAFWKWAAKEYSIANPTANVKRAKAPKPKPKAIAASDFVKLYDSCGDDEAGYRNRAILAFLADTGVRVQGLVDLKLTDLHLHSLQAVITEKGGKTRIVVYTKYTRALLATWLQVRPSGSEYVWTSLITGAPLTTSGVEQLLRRMKKAAGITGRVNPHSFRHAFAREYLKAGGDAIRLAKLIGHSDVNTTAAYYAIFTPDELAAMHETYSPLKQMMGVNS